MKQSSGAKASKFSTKARFGKRIAVASAIAVATFGAPLVGSTARAQDPPCVVNGRQLRVVQTYDRYVDAKFIFTSIAELTPTSAVNVSYLSGTAWSGGWFTTPNGPFGWPSWLAPAGGHWAAPGVSMFSLVGHVFPYIDNGINLIDASFSAAAAPQWCIHLNGYGQYGMAVNDDYRADDTGGFWVRVQLLDR